MTDLAQLRDQGELRDFSAVRTLNFPPSAFHAIVQGLEVIRWQERRPILRKRSTSGQDEDDWRAEEAMVVVARQGTGVPAEWTIVTARAIEPRLEFLAEWPETGSQITAAQDTRVIVLGDADDWALAWSPAYAGGKSTLAAEDGRVTE